jgi:hypothetical protein
MDFEFEVDFKNVANALSVELPRQVPFAMAHTLTLLAKDGKEAIVKALPVVFDRPVQFTLSGVTFEKATKATMASKVFFRQSDNNSGKAKNEHIRPGAQGAVARNQKKTEFLLTRLGFLPAGWVTVPGNKMPVVASSGNMAGSYYKDIINVLQLKTGSRFESGHGRYIKSQKRASKMGVATELFAVAPGLNSMAKGGGWLPPGVYKHLPGRRLLQMLKFVRKASYSKRLDVDAVVKKAVDTNLQRRWDEAAAGAIATAFKK